MMMMMMMSLQLELHSRQNKKGNLSSLRGKDTIFDTKIETLKGFVP